MYLTKGERAILIFLTLSALLGVGMNYYKKLTDKLDVKVIPVNTDRDDRAIEALLQRSKLVNINTADVETLKRLTGIGPSLAKEIVAHRNINGLFQNVEALNNVKGIGPKKLEAVKPYLTTDEQ